MHVPILEEIVIILGLSMVVLLVGARLRIPPIVGFLLTGVVAGPYGLGLIQASERVEVLAEVGVILLMFTIGLEFSFKSLVRIKKTVLLGGSTQALITLGLGATPACMGLAPRAANWVDRLPLPSRYKGVVTTSDAIKLEGHLIIVGFGPSGHHLARAAKVSNIPYAIVEMNPDTVRKERAKGQPILFGDASQEAVLKHVGVHHAYILVIVISDAAAAGRTVEVARRLNPSLHILTRTHFVAEVEALQAIGANDVIPDDLESSVEIFTRVLTHYLVPHDQIDQFAADIRAGTYENGTDEQRESQSPESPESTESTESSLEKVS